jgi:hypothetical protein
MVICVAPDPKLPVALCSIVYVVPSGGAVKPSYLGAVAQLTDTSAKARSANARYNFTLCLVFTGDLLSELRLLWSGLQPARDTSKQKAELDLL